MAMRKAVSGQTGILPRELHLAAGVGRGHLMQFVFRTSSVSRQALRRSHGWIHRVKPRHAIHRRKSKICQRSVNFEQGFQQKLQVDDFCRCVIEDKPSIVSGEEGWKDMLIIDAIHKAIASGRHEKIATV